MGKDSQGEGGADSNFEQSARNMTNLLLGGDCFKDGGPTDLPPNGKVLWANNAQF